MSDAILNKFVASGTAAERLAFTPAPPAPPAGPDHAYLWFETDTASLYAWDVSGAGWTLVATGSLAALTGTVGALLAAVDDLVFIEVPYSGTITAWRMIGMTSTGASLAGDAVVDVWKSDYTGFPPTVTESIAGSEKPELSGVAKSEDTTLNGSPGWSDVTIDPGDWLAFKLESMTTIEKVLVQLTIARG